MEIRRRKLTDQYGSKSASKRAHSQKVRLCDGGAARVAGIVKGSVYYVLFGFAEAAAAMSLS